MEGVVMLRYGVVSRFRKVYSVVNTRPRDRGNAPDSLAIERGTKWTPFFKPFEVEEERERVQQPLLSLNPFPALR